MAVYCCYSICKCEIGFFFFVLCAEKKIFICKMVHASTLQLQMIETKKPSDAIVVAGVASGVRQKIDSQVT